MSGMTVECPPARTDFALREGMKMRMRGGSNVGKGQMKAADSGGRSPTSSATKAVYRRHGTTWRSREGIPMSKMRMLMAVLVAGVLLSGLAMAAGKTYQVTGPVLEVTADKIVVQKGQDKWELRRDASTKVNGDLVVGAKATITYTMT